MLEEKTEQYTHCAVAVNPDVMQKVDLECFAECFDVPAEGLVKGLLGEVCGVGGGEDGEDALLQALIGSLRAVGWDALVSSWGQLGSKLIFPIREAIK